MWKEKEVAICAQDVNYKKVIQRWFEKTPQEVGKDGIMEEKSTADRMSISQMEMVSVEQLVPEIKSVLDWVLKI